jgi:hypothetical protein
MLLERYERRQRLEDLGAFFVGDDAAISGRLQSRRPGVSRRPSPYRPLRRSLRRPGLTPKWGINSPFSQGRLWMANRCRNLWWPHPSKPSSKEILGRPAQLAPQPKGSDCRCGWLFTLLFARMLTCAVNIEGIAMGLKLFIRTATWMIVWHCVGHLW